MPEFVAQWPTALDTFPRLVAGVTKTGDAGKNHVALLNGVFDVAENLEEWAGISGTPAPESAEARLRAAGQLVFNVQLGLPAASVGPVLPSQSAATNTTNLQALLDVVAFFGGKATLFFPAGVYQLNEITISSSSTVLQGQAIDSTFLEYHGGTAAHALLNFHGTADNVTTGRIYWNGVNNMTLSNQGNGNSKALDAFSCTHLDVHNVRFLTFRGTTIMGGNFADSFFVQCHFDYCGSNDGSNRAVIDFGTNGSTAWAVDAVTFLMCRFEQCGDRLVNLVSNTGANLFVNKIRFIATKFENSTEGTDGIFGNTSQFELSNNGGVAFIGCEITLQARYNGVYTTPIAAMFKITGANGFAMSDCYISLGSKGANKKEFTTYFDVDGGSNLSWSGVTLTSGNDGCYPTSVWKWANTPVKVSRIGCGWAFAPGTSEPLNDVGTTPSLNDWAGPDIPIQFVSATATAIVGITSVDSSGGNRTINLPSVVGLLGKSVWVKKTTSGNTVTIDGAGSETIDGSTTLALTGTQGVHLVADGFSNWSVLANA